MSDNKHIDQITYKVSQSNELITNMRVPLTMNEQKLIVMAISMIKPTDHEFKWYSISVVDFCRMTGIKSESFYSDFAEMAKDILTKQADAGKVIEHDGRVFMTKWLYDIEYIPKTGQIRLLFDVHLMPYLLDLKKNFTQYELWTVLRMKGKYSFRLFQLLKKDAYDRRSVSIEYNIEKLKDILMANTYTTFKDFRVRCIDRAVKEINECSDVMVEYDIKKKGKKVDRLNFTITKKGRDDAYAAYTKVKDQLNDDHKQIPGQLSIFDKTEEEFIDYKMPFIVTSD